MSEVNYELWVAALDQWLSQMEWRDYLEPL